MRGPTTSSRILLLGDNNTIAMAATREFFVVIGSGIDGGKIPGPDMITEQAADGSIANETNQNGR
jgi:hypothetical protein